MINGVDYSYYWHKENWPEYNRLHRIKDISQLNTEAVFDVLGASFADLDRDIDYRARDYVETIKYIHNSRTIAKMFGEKRNDLAELFRKRCGFCRKSEEITNKLTLRYILDSLGIFSVPDEKRSNYQDVVDKLEGVSSKCRTMIHDLESKEMSALTMGHSAKMLNSFYSKCGFHDTEEMRK